MAVVRGRHDRGAPGWARIGGMDEGMGKVLALPQAPDAIELRHLRAFVAVADELNFGRAAARLYLSQPALSRQIRALERLVGCALLRRSTHRVELTLAGEALLDRTRKLLSGVDEAISATRSVGGELAGRMARMWEPFAEFAAADEDLQNLRTATEDMHGQFPQLDDVDVRPVNAGGVPSLLLTPQPERPLGLLYLHGGGYVTGSAFGYRHLAGALAAAASAATLLPEYRLAPEHPFPAALEDVLRAYVWLLDGGTDPATLAVAGDSAAGGLVLSLLLSLKQQDLPQPGCALLLCPWVDLTCELLGKAKPDQVVVTPEQGRHFAGLYLNGHPADDPLVSPLTADLTGLPPLLVQAATGDTTLEEAHQLVDRARAHGVEARIELYPVPTHDFHVFWSFLPEAREALHQAGKFAQDTTRTDDRRTSRTGGDP
jgi:acetyl esterase/lipase